MLAAHLSSTSTAMEYWDVTAWLESGERFFARFLVTNQGPGVQTAAAVGHLVLPGGEIVPFKWGRRRDAWRLGPEGRSLTIAKARLELDAPTVVISVESEKRGIKLRLEIARTAPLVTTTPLPDGYAVEVVMPSPARGRVWTRGMDAARDVTGTGALTHTWMERPEGDLVRRRVELLSREADAALYIFDLTLADGRHRSTVIASRAGRILARADDVTLSFGHTTTADGDPRYPLATEWKAASTALAARVTVGRELLRMDPLDILPPPFRMLLALGGRPRRVWAEAEVDLRVTPPGGGDPERGSNSGIVVATFARPLEQP